MLRCVVRLQTDHAIELTRVICQLSAVVQVAHINGSDFYSYNWSGPAATEFDPLGAMAALDVINPALMFSSASAM